MAGCTVLTKQMLSKPIEIHVDNESLDFQETRAIADREAREVSEDPMLLAWFSSATGEHSPRVECCNELKPGWLVYAETRGGDVVVDINDELFVFIYRP